MPDTPPPVTLSAHVEVVEAELPGDCAAAATRVGRTLWLVVDTAKPDAWGHAEELLRTERPLPAMLFPRPTSVPKPRQGTPWVHQAGTLAAAVLTGAAIWVSQMDGLVAGVTV